MVDTSKYTVSLLSSAKEDIKELFEYILSDNPDAAKNWLHKLNEAMTNLSLFPFKNPAFKYTSIPCRKMIFNKNIAVIYTVKDKDIYILHCFRCKKDF